MTSLMNQVRSFVKDESGQDLLEYALLVALIALVAIVGVRLAGQNANSIFNNIATQISGS